MTDTHELHYQLDLLSSEVTTDLVALDRVARTRGGRIRRQRQGVAVLGGAAVAAIAVLGVTAIGGGAPDTSRTAASSPEQTDEPVERPSVATIDGRTTAALLDEMVGEVAPAGATSDHAGQGGDRGAHRDTYAELRLTPAGDQGFGYVGVNIQGRDVIEDLGGFGCLGYMGDCTSRTLPNGDRLRTYYEPSDGAGDVELVAERWTGDDTVRIIVSAGNGLDLGGNEWEIARPTPVLDLGELVEIVRDPRWGFEVPGEYVAAGRRLDPYTDLD